MSEEQMQLYKTAYYQTLESEEQLKFFLQWFLDYYVNQQEQIINVLDEHCKQWKTSTGSIVRSIYLPTNPLTLSRISTSNLKIIAFVKSSEDKTSDDKILKELDKLFKQKIILTFICKLSDNSSPELKLL